MKEREEREAMRESGERKALNQNILCDAVNHLKFSIKAVSNLTPTGTTITQMTVMTLFPKESEAEARGCSR